MDEYFARTDIVGSQYFLTDALGSTVALTDSARALQPRYTYEPFGRTTVSGADRGSSYQYTGRENDGTGLYFYRARYYNPTFQRFISQDPIDFVGGINLYAYVNNSPVRFRDPSGDQPQWALAGAGPVGVGIAIGITAIVAAYLYLRSPAGQEAVDALDRSIPRPKPKEKCKKGIWCKLAFELEEPDPDGFAKFKICFYTCSDGPRFLTRYVYETCPPDWEFLQ